MAKHCNICNQDYADDLPACPHCAAARSGPSDSMIDLGPAPQGAPSTGDAAGVDPASLSGGSDVHWAALVEEPDEPKVKVDSPSDADLLAHEAAQPASPPLQPASSVSDSAVDLGASPAELVEEVPPSESDVFVAELASDAKKVELVEEPVEAEMVAEEVKPGEDDGGRDVIAEAVEAGADPTRPEA